MAKKETRYFKGQGRFRPKATTQEMLAHAIDRYNHMMGIKEYKAKADKFYAGKKAPRTSDGYMVDKIRWVAGRNPEVAQTEAREQLRMAHAAATEAAWADDPVLENEFLLIAADLEQLACANYRPRARARRPNPARKKNPDARSALRRAMRGT